MNDPNFIKSFDMPQRGRPKKQYQENENVIQNQNYIIHNTKSNEYQTNKEINNSYDKVNSVETEMKKYFEDKSSKKNEIKNKNSTVNNNLDNMDIFENMFNLNKQKDKNYNKGNNEYYNNCNDIFDYERSTYNNNEDNIFTPRGMNYPYKEKVTYPKQEEKEYSNEFLNKMNYESNFLNKNEQICSDFNKYNSEQSKISGNNKSNNIFCSDQSEIHGNKETNNIFFSEQLESHEKGESNINFFSEQLESHEKRGSNNIFNSSNHNQFNGREMIPEEHNMSKRMFHNLKQNEYTTGIQNKLLENTLFTSNCSINRKFHDTNNTESYNNSNLYGRIENDYTEYNGIQKPKYTDFEYQGRFQENKNDQIFSQHGSDMFYNDEYKNHNKIRQNNLNNDYCNMDYTTAINYLYRQPPEYRDNSIICGFRKKRKSNSCMLNATNIKNYKSTIPPSRYSSLEYIKGIENREIMNINVHQSNKDKSRNNSLLGTIIESDFALNKEHKAILESYKNDITNLDLENITVFQLKSLMKEYGLNTIGKKNDLIKILKDTLKKAEDANNRKDILKPTIKKEDFKDLVSYDKFFF